MNTLKRLKYSLIYALNFNRSSKFNSMNLTRTYINTDKTNEKIKVQFPKKIDRDLSVFRLILHLRTKETENDRN